MSSDSCAPTQLTRAQGFRDAYAGRMLQPPADLFGALAYAAGRVGGMALRQRHQHEFEQVVFAQMRMRAPMGPGEEGI